MAKINELSDLINRQQLAYDDYALARKQVDEVVQAMQIKIGEVNVYFKDGRNGIAVFVNNKELSIEEGIELGHGLLRLLTNIYDAEAECEAPCTDALANPPTDFTPDSESDGTPE